MATQRNTVRPRLEPITIKNAELRWNNFAGVGRKFNAEGDRNFHVVIDMDTAKEMEKLGWNIKYHEPKEGEEGKETWASLKVAVRFDKFPPRIMMKSAGVRTTLSKNTVGILDWAQVDNVNLHITASYWENAKKESGFKAYLSRMSVEVDPDDAEFEGIDLKPIRDESSSEND